MLGNKILFKRQFDEVKSKHVNFFNIMGTKSQTKDNFIFADHYEENQ